MQNCRKDTEGDTCLKNVKTLEIYNYMNNSF